MKLLHTTLRCALTENKILDTIDNAIGSFGNSRVRVAETLISAAIEAPVKVWFEGEMMSVQIPANYATDCSEKGMAPEQIIEDCLICGIRMRK